MSGWGSPGPGAGEGSAGSLCGPSCWAQTARGCPPLQGLAPGARVQCSHRSGRETEVTREVCPLTGLAGNPGLWVQGPGWPPRLRAQSPPGNAWVDPAGAHGQVQPQTGPCLDTALQTWNAGTPAQRGIRGPTALGSILLRCFNLGGHTHCPCPGCLGPGSVPRAGEGPLPPESGRFMQRGLTPKQGCCAQEQGGGREAAQAIDGQCTRPGTEVELKGTRCAPQREGLRQGPRAHFPSPDCVFRSPASDKKEIKLLGAGRPFLPPTASQAKGSQRRNFA